MAGFLQRRREEKRERKEAERQFLACSEEVLADDIVTEEEEERLVGLLEAVLGDATITPQSKFYEVGRRLEIAKANAGRLPEVESPNLITKPGEVVHAEAAAA